jgi:hypothetical protein
MYLPGRVCSEARVLVCALPLKMGKLAYPRWPARLVPNAAPLAEFMIFFLLRPPLASVLRLLKGRLIPLGKLHRTYCCYQHNKN